GVNDFVQENEQISIPILEISKEVETKQRQRLSEVRSGRSDSEVKAALEGLLTAARDGSNLMPELLRATRAYATLGEMCETLKEVFGVYEEPVVF
ncbi:MAG: hypothetical protein B7Z63_04675, partial [Ignavibacteriae bacterium 37-53-5]